MRVGLAFHALIQKNLHGIPVPTSLPALSTTQIATDSGKEVTIVVFGAYGSFRCHLGRHLPVRGVSTQHNTTVLRASSLELRPGTAEVGYR